MTDSQRVVAEGSAASADASPSEELILEVEKLRVEVPGRSLLDDADLTLRSGESVAVTGPSGSGKSTLLMCLLGLSRPTAGRVRVAGADITGMRPRKLARHRRAHIGTIFQFGELLPELTPVENVAVAALLSGVRRSAAFERAASLLARLGVSADTVATSQLSGGERQRTAVARALINKPSLLLADEPTGALDERNRGSVSDLLFGLPEETGCGLLVVTHDAAVAARADRTVHLADGRLAEAVA
jgi:lipoprotein-releasing system ATP-binding protein